MERADYSKPGIVKGLLRNYDELMKLAMKGDCVALTICVDIKRAVHAEGVLTFKQRRYLRLWWEGYTLTDIATIYQIGPQRVLDRINAGVRNICKFLNEVGENDPTLCP